MSDQSKTREKKLIICLSHPYYTIIFLVFIKFFGCANIGIYIPYLSMTTTLTIKYTREELKHRLAKSLGIGKLKGERFTAQNDQRPVKNVQEILFVHRTKSVVWFNFHNNLRFVVKVKKTFLLKAVIQYRIHGLSYPLLYARNVVSTSLQRS